jgi:hypothetical protein
MRRNGELVTTEKEKVVVCLKREPESSSGNIRLLIYFLIREKRNACRILVARPEGKRPAGRTKSRSVHNIKINLRETELGDIDWTSGRPL